jgi:UDP-N-acetyl-D-glucosamine dehydrogenase
MIPSTREYLHLEGRVSVALDEKTISSYDVLVVSTDHDAIDYALITKYGRLLIDTRNVFSRLGLSGTNVVKA